MKFKSSIAQICFVGLIGCSDRVEDLGSSLQADSQTITGTPAANPNCEQAVSSLKPVENGAGVLWDEECKTAYVLPPVQGTAELKALAKNQNLQFCSAMNLTTGVVESTVRSAAVIAASIEKSIAAHTDQRAELEKGRVEVAQKKAEEAAANAELQAAEKRKIELTNEIILIQNEVNSCQAMGAECSQQLNALTELRNSLRNHIASVLSKAQNTHNQKKIVAETAEAIYAAKESEWIKIVKPLIDLQDSLFKLNTSVMDIYKQYAQLEGATGQIVYTIPWDDLIADYTAKNPGINFSRLRVVDGEFYATRRLNDSKYASQIPALLWSVIPGAARKGLTQEDMPDGSKVVEPNTDMDPDLSKNIMSGVLQSVSGQIGLSLAGACPYFPKGIADSDSKDIDSIDLNAYLVVNANLSYEVTARRGYTASYNLSQWVSKVQRASDRKGFFSSKSVRSVTEDGDSKDWFTIDFDTNSSQFSYSPAEQAQITDEVKKNLVERALASMGRITSLSSQPPMLPDMPPVGASQTSERLYHGCWFWKYCQAAGWAIGTAESIFGSNKEAVSNFSSNHNVWTKETVNGRTVLPRNAMVSFSPLSEPE